jgi:hypothetical protein
MELWQIRVNDERTLRTLVNPNGERFVVRSKEDLQVLLFQHGMAEDEANSIIEKADQNGGVVAMLPSPQTNR